VAKASFIIRMRFSPLWFVDFGRTRVGASYWKDKGEQAPEGDESVAIGASFILESGWAIGEGRPLRRTQKNRASNAGLGKITG